MSLNIKNERVHGLARDLARRLQTTQTSAIEQALSQMLASLDERPDGGRRQAVDRILADLDSRLDDRTRAALSTGELYDNRGLPA